MTQIFLPLIDLSLVRKKMENNQLPILLITENHVIYPLPHQKELINHLNADVLRQARLKNTLREKRMNFMTAVQEAKNGAKVRRCIWDKDMYLWYTHNVCLHTHPYVPDQPEIYNGYFYVCEEDDAFAKDWELAV